MFGDMPMNYNVAVNANHPVISKILNGGSEDEKKRIPVSFPSTLALTISTLLVILLGFLPTPVIEWATRAAQALFS